MDGSSVAATVAAVDAADLIAPITGSLANFNTDNLAIILVAGVGIATGLVIMWFGYNFLKRKLMGALKKGKL